MAGLRVDIPWIQGRYCVGLSKGYPCYNCTMSRLQEYLPIIHRSSTTYLLTNWTFLVIYGSSVGCLKYVLGKHNTSMGYLHFNHALSTCTSAHFRHGYGIDQVWISTVYLYLIQVQKCTNTSKACIQGGATTLYVSSYATKPLWEKYRLVNPARQFSSACSWLGGWRRGGLQDVREAFEIRVGEQGQGWCPEHPQLG